MPSLSGAANSARDYAKQKWNGPQSTANLAHAYLTFEGDDKPIQCMFNPESLDFSYDNSWDADTGLDKGITIGGHRGSTPPSPKSTPGKDIPTMQFSGRGSGTFSLKLFFDTTDDGTDVSLTTNQLVAKMEIDPDLPGSNPKSANGRPPWVRFQWGKLVTYRAVITKLDIAFDYFAMDGTPLRARVGMNLKQYEKDPVVKAQNPTSGTPVPHRVHRVQPGETLDRISAAYYGQSTNWRLLAEANGIEDPLALRPGSLLSVPRLD